MVGVSGQTGNVANGQQSAHCWIVDVYQLPGPTTLPVC